MISGSRDETDITLGSRDPSTAERTHDGKSELRLAYLISRYPSISHAFILREVRALQSLGVEIRTASINVPDRSGVDLTADEQSAVETTLYVKRRRPLEVLDDHLSALIRSAPLYLSALAFSWKLGGWDLGRIVKHTMYFAESVIVGEWMRRNRLRHIYCHFAGPASTVALITSRSHTVTFSVTIHGPDEFYDVGRAHLSRKMHDAAYVLCIGDYARSQMMFISEAEHWDKLEVAPLGVDPDLFLPVPRQQVSPAAPFELICVGRLVPAKGQHILIQAIERLVRQGRSIQLRLVGDGPDRSSLEDAVKERGLVQFVVFEGAVNQDSIRELYGRADAFVLASFAEGIPVVLMEAMAMEIPCISTWITGIPELIRNGTDGLLVPPSSSKALADAIASLMDDPELCERLGRQARLRVTDRYNLEPNIAHLAQIMLRRLGPSLRPGSQ